MPKRNLKKKLNKIRKGCLVRCINDDVNLSEYYKKPSRSFLSLGDFGIVIERSRNVSQKLKHDYDVYYTIYWQRIGSFREVSYKKFEIVKQKLDITQ